MPGRSSLRKGKALTDLPNPPDPRDTYKVQSRAGAVFRTRDSQGSDRHSNIEEHTEEKHQGLRLRVKMPSSRLREVTNVAPKDLAPIASTRSTRNIKKSYVVETTSEEEEEDEELEDYADADADEDEIAEEATPNPLPEADEDEEEADEDDVEAEIDADGDVEMDDDADDGVPLGHHPPPPILKVNPPAAPKGKTTIIVKAAPKTHQSEKRRG